MYNELKENQIFVFGSNLNGNHYGGAAKQAYEQFGAEWGVGEGTTGRCYAFPTLGQEMEKRTFPEWIASKQKLFRIAEENPDKEFLLTKVGCGIAGYDEDWVKTCFYGAPKNIIKPEDW